MVEREDCLFVSPEGRAINETDYKVMQNSCRDYLVRCQKLKVNGEDELCYLTEDLISLKELLQKREYHSAAACICGIADAVGHVQLNGFLNIRNLISDANMIFSSGSSVRLAYMPCISPLHIDEEHFWKSICTSIMNNAVSCEATAIAREMRELSAGAELSGDIIRARLLPLCGTREECETNPSRSARMVTRNGADIFTLEIDRGHYVIGKNPEQADGVIDFNNTVSRKHCCIDSFDDHYSVTDLGSSNGTYVNEVRAEADVPVRIDDGDVIRLANCTFVFRVVK